MNRITPARSIFSLLLASLLLLTLPSLTFAGPPDQPPPASADVDDDGLPNDDETTVGTDAANADSDGDGIRDGLDPDILAYRVQRLPAAAFKSKGKGHRNAILKQLRTSERQLQAGKVDAAVHDLEQLRKHLDGCPAKPDKNDWIDDCDAQLAARYLLDLLLANHVGVAIDPAIEPPVASIPGVNGGAPRGVGVALDPQGNSEAFVFDEIVLRPENQWALEAFLVKYDGVVVRDGSATLLPDSEPRAGLPADSGWYLVRVNPMFSALDDLAANMERHGLRGNWSFSTAAAARTAAIVAREDAMRISLNFIMDELSAQSVLEHPDDSGGNLDASKWPWMTEDDDPVKADDQGLSIGVIHAWEYVQYKGYPPVDTPYVPLKLAIIDAGFDLDETTGEPLYGGGDYPFDLQQFDAIDSDSTAGGAGYGFNNCNGCWHGQLSYGVCCALSNNHYGTAGSSGGWNVRPLLIKATSDIDTVSRGIYNALYNGADVIHETIAFECGWWCRNFDGGGELSSMVSIAKSWDVILVTPAQNQGRDISGSDVMPCNRDGAVCVGAIEGNGLPPDYSNWGSIVDTWSPTNLYSTITRDSANRPNDSDDVGLDELQFYDGTSAATPFLTGIVALMKMVNPQLTYEQTRTILVSTANPSTHPKVKARGYVDAYRAVKAAQPNLPPLVQIIQPAQGASEPYSNIFFKAQVVDPEKPNPYGGRADFMSTIEFRSDRDGLLCSAAADATGSGAMMSCEVASMSPGAHVITAKVTDPFDGVGTDTINLGVINTPPVAKITFPADGAIYASNQQINFRGYGFDAEVYGFIPVSWSSSITGALGTSNDFWVSLSVGDHLITLQATDEKGATKSDSISVQVKSASGGGGFPQVQITQPANGAVFGPGSNIQFSGQATDPEDGNISADSAYRWTSSVDGFLGTGKSRQNTLSISGESTVHTITLEVSDSDGNSSSHSIDLAILNPQ